jgi:hypothetical protein
MRQHTSVSAPAAMVDRTAILTVNRSTAGIPCQSHEELDQSAVVMASQVITQSIVFKRNRGRGMVVQGRLWKIAIAMLSTTTPVSIAHAHQAQIRR